MQKSRLKVIGATAAVAVVAGGGIGAWWVASDSSGGEVISASAGAEARAEQAAHLPGGGAGEAALAASSTMAADSKVAADSMIAIDCGFGGEPYVPTEEELAAANADTDALTAVLERYGVAHTVTTDDSGFRYVETDYNDMVANSVVASYWDTRYPVEPVSQADLDQVKHQNDVIAKYLDQAGESYTRTTDDAGWESLEWNYDSTTAQEAVDAAYTELYPPQPPTAEELATITADNDKLAAAFDAAGIPYTRMSDELGWEWIEWDYEDAALSDKVNAVFAELYPVDPNGCGSMVDDTPMPEATPAMEEPSVDESAEAAPPLDPEEVDASQVVVSSDGEAVAAEPDPVDAESTISIAPAPGSEFTAEQLAQRDAEASAMQSGMEAAGVKVRTEGESPWQVVLFDTDNDASVEVIKGILAARG